MGKIIEVRNLYKDTINDVAKDIDNWLSFLSSASYNFKYSFDDQILIYAQRPDATACAGMEIWNKKLKRWVNKNSQVIFVNAKEDSLYPYRMIFDVSDTHNYRNTPYKLWEVKKEYENDIIETLEESFGEITSKESLAEAINLSAYNMVMDNQQDYLLAIQNYKVGTELENMTDDEIQMLFISTLWASVSYMMMKRCGIEPDIEKSEFSFISKFNDENVITIFGTATSDIAEMGLREIAKTVINLQREGKNKNRTFVDKLDIDYSNNEKEIKGGNENDENRLQQTRRLYDTKFNIRGGETTNRQVRSNEIEVLKDTQESRIHDTLERQETSRAFNGDTGNSNKENSIDSRTNETTDEYNGGIESSRPDGMGRTDEQLQTDSRGTSDEGIDFQLGILTESEQKEKIAEVENTSVFLFTQEMIDSVLKEGSHFESGKFRIYEYLTRGLPEKENIEFLKKEYGTGGRSADDNGVSENHSYKGIKLSIGYESNSPTLLLNWKQVEKRIRELISADRYFNEKEKNEYFDWLDSNEISTNTLKNINKEEDYELENSLLNYEFSSGDIVYIGTDEFEIRTIDNEKVTLVDTSFPLFSKEMQREEFEKKIKENPANDKLRTEKKPENKTKSIEKIEIQENKQEDTEKPLLERLHKFLNEYDIYDVDEVTLDEVRETLNDKQQILDTIKYFYLILDSDDEVYEFTNELRAFIKELDDLYEEKDKITEQIKEDKSKEEKIKINIKKKRRNKIEYFDLHPEIALKDRNNYTIENNELGVGTPKEKFRRNIEAIKVLKKCTEENRYATQEEQEVLAQYVGWGGLADAFEQNKDSWASEYRELKELLTEKEYEEARASSLTAFYTPPIVINSIYKALENMGLERGNLLEPSCRSRKFYGDVTREIK